MTGASLAVIVPLAVGLGVVVYGVGLSISTHRRAYARVVAGWSLVGTAGVAWASRLDGVDHLGSVRDTLGYMRDSLFGENLGIYRAGAGNTHSYTARDVGDITGGVNAANTVLGLGGVKEQYAQFFN